MCGKHKYLSIQERATCHSDLHSDSLDGEEVRVVENGQNDDRQAHSHRIQVSLSFWYAWFRGEISDQLSQQQGLHNLGNFL